MAKYLDTSQISSELMQLLKEAKEKIILVTFSLKVNVQIQERLKTKSKLGTLSEITIIYGNTQLKSSELEWMKEIDDIRIFQKKNLHAKCYINEKKAIISSMNLYDYSQTSNIEMGFLITKDEDNEAYLQMMEDIADLKINGERIKKIDEISNSQNTKNANEKLHSSETKKEQNSALSYNQQIKKQLLEYYRNDMSSYFKRNAHSILSNDEIEEIISRQNVTFYLLKHILKSSKKAKELSESILNRLEIAQKFTSGKIIDTRYQNDEFAYDQIRMYRFDDNSTNWYDTKKELPRKGQIVAVQLNGEWFNDYFILNKSEVNEAESQEFKDRDLNNTSYKTTKEISKITGVMSKEINSTLVSFGFMRKNGNDWYLTDKGERFGGIQKEGQYGKFIVWPEEIIAELKLNF